MFPFVLNLNPQSSHKWASDGFRNITAVWILMNIITQTWEVTRLRSNLGNISVGCSVFYLNTRMTPHRKLIQLRSWMSDVYVKMLLRSQDGNITPSENVLITAMSRVRLTREVKTKPLVLFVFRLDWRGRLFLHFRGQPKKTQRGDRPVRSNCSLPSRCSPQD